MERVQLLGADDVRAAAREISSAAETMRHTQGFQTQENLRHEAALYEENARHEAALREIVDDFFSRLAAREERP